MSGFSGQSPEGVGSQAEPGNQRDKLPSRWTGFPVLPESAFLAGQGPENLVLRMNAEYGPSRETRDGTKFRCSTFLVHCDGQVMPVPQE